jgi:hypothetical protein
VKVHVRAIFDTSEWKPGELRWQAGWQTSGVRIPCSSMDDIKIAIESVEGLGHKAEVVYPDIQEA